MDADATVLEIPSHIDPALVVDFDYLNPAGIEEGDAYRALARLHAGPDIVWTPRHGGHWIATRGEDIKWVQQSWEIFSNREKGVPKGISPFMPPITKDPPEHARYRAVFNRYFAKRQIEEIYQPRAREIIIDLIETLRPRGTCEFVSEFAFVAPLRVFFDFVNLPFERRDEFLAWGRAMAGYPGDMDRRQGHQAISRYLKQLLDERLQNPGDDIFTGISQWRDNPRFESEEELVGMAVLVFAGGQDTVASLMGFVAYQLASRPELQARLRAEPDIIPQAVEEFLRRHGLSNSARLVAQDCERKGATMKKGDMIMTCIGLSGVDERLYDDPFLIDFDRAPAPMNTFGNGAHRCPGAPLAQMELRVFLEEWRRRMPPVRIDPDKPAPVSHAGIINGMTHLHLKWDVGAGG